jgi:hypothetical protein
MQSGIRSKTLSKELDIARLARCQARDRRVSKGGKHSARTTIREAGSDALRELLSNAVDGIDQAATALMPSTNRIP